MNLPILVVDPRHQAVLKPRLFAADRFWPGVSAWMILTHFAYRNALTVDELQAYVGAFRSHGLRKKPVLDWNLAAPPWVRSKLRSELNLAEAVIHRAGLDELKGEAGLMVSNLRFCPRCLQQGIHTIAHQFRLVRLCPVHRERLTESCPACVRTIEYRFNARSFRLPGRCPHCGTPLIPNSAVGRPPGADSSQAAVLIPFCDELVKRLVGVRRENMAFLSAWFTLMHCLPPQESDLSPRYRKWLAALGRLEPKGISKDADTAWSRGDSLYRQVARECWNQFSSEEQKAIMKWGRAQQQPVEIIMAGVLTVAQFVYLAWRMTWETRRIPASLFRRQGAPAAGVAVWLAYNALPRDQEETEQPSQSLSEQEKEGLLLALVKTHQRWRQLAGQMQLHRQFLLCPDLVPIPGDFSDLRS